MNKPIVSIITPAFKCKSTIEETYQSIIKQSFRDWEWIIVEDNSNDGTYEFIKNLIKDDKRIILLKTNENSGAAIARNVGIEHAIGKYIAFLDSDDLWKPEKLQKQIKFMSDNCYAFTFTNYDLLFFSGNIKKHKIKKSQVRYKDLLKRNYIGCLTVVYDSDILGKIFMPLDCEKREDHGAWLDVTRNGTIAYKMNDYLSMYRIGNNTVSSNKFKMIKYQYRLYRKHEQFGPFKSMLFTLICSANKLFHKY